MLKRHDLTLGTAVFLAALFVFFAMFLVYPLWYAIIGAFYVDGAFTLKFFDFMLTNPVYVEAILNSFRLAMVTTLSTTLLSLPLALLLVRYDFKGKGILQGMILVPMVLPPFVGAIGMKQMFARFGSVNLLLMRMDIIDQPIDFFGGGGFLGVVILEVLHLYPIMYLNVAAALSNIDPSLDEAARNVGSSGFRLFRTITFPLMLPGYFAGAIIVFIWAFTDLGTPLVFNFRRVIAVEIFNSIADINENPVAYALVVLVIVMTIFFYYLAKRVMGGQKYEMITRGHVAGAQKPATPGITAAIWAIMILVTGFALLPHLSIVLTSFADRWFMTVLPESTTLSHYGMVFDHPLSSSSIRISLLLSVCSTVLDIVVGVTIAYLLVRTSIPFKGVLDGLAMLPLALPGLVLAFGYLAGYSGTILDARHFPLPLLVIAYGVRRLPYMVRAAYAGFQQTSVALEEAAINMGASRFRAVWQITFPLILANLVAGGILCFSFAMLEVSDSLILAMKGDYYPITRAIYALLGRMTDGAYIASAMGVLGMFLLMASLFLAGRFLGRRMGELFRA
jgi:iron(III) transport system permease protein